jgi:hypothetical protein
MNSQRVRAIAIVVLMLLIGIAGAAQTPGPTQISPSEGSVLDNGCQNRRDPIRWDFEWQPIAGAQTYRLYIKRTGSVRKLLDIQIHSTSYERNEPLAYIAPMNLAGWRWSVRALVNGQWTSWSTSNFTVEPLDTDCPLGIIK